MMLRFIASEYCRTAAAYLDLAAEQHREAALAHEVGDQRKAARHLRCANDEVFHAHHYSGEAANRLLVGTF